MYGVGLRQPQTDFKCFIYIIHCSLINLTHSGRQSAFINGADLFAQSHTFTRQAAGGIDSNVSG